MTDNPDYGTALFQLLARGEDSDAAPLVAYLAADPARAATADRRYVLVVRFQFGNALDGRWHNYARAPARSSLTPLVSR